jgi:DHA2 family multidrug resistance protein-like MFS transporter
LSLEIDSTPPVAPASAPIEADGLPTPQRYLAILAIWLAISMAVLDGAIANVALPTIGRELGADPAGSIWIINAYQVAITMALIPLASLGDKIGYRKVYMAGLGLFTVGSLACALSHSLPMLIAARMAQGLGAAGVMSINAALVRHIYPQKQLGHGIGLNAVVISISAAAGPSIAAAILSVASWEWLFAINVPIGIVAVIIAFKALPVTRGSGAPLDFLSAGLNAVAFGGLILGVERLAREGLAQGLPVLAVGAVGAVLLARRELSREHPLVPIDLLRIPIFSLSLLTSIVSFTAQMLALVALPFFFQNTLGRDAVATGLLMTPWPLAVGLAAPIGGKLSDRYPAGLLGAIGLGVFATGLALLALLPHGAGNLDIVWRMAICGAGFGFFQSPNNRTIVSAAPRHRSGGAGGMLATARLLGQTAGAVGMAVLFHLGGANPTTAALSIGAGVAACAALVSLSRLRAA